MARCKSYEHLKNNKYASFKPIERWQNNRKNWVTIDLNTFSGKNAISTYNMFRMQNKSERLTAEQWEKIAKDFRPATQLKNKDIAIKKVKSYLKDQQVKAIADNDLRAALLRNNIDVDYVLSERKELIERAKKNKQFSAVNTALDRLENHLGLLDRVKVTETRTVNAQEALEDSYKQAKTSKIKQKVTIEQQNKDVNND